MRWVGDLVVPSTGTYVFTVESDDSATLLVGGRVVVDNSGLHGLQRRADSRVIPRGRHRVELLYAEYGGDVALHAALRGPDGVSRPLHASLVAPSVITHPYWLRGLVVLATLVSVWIVVALLRLGSLLAWRLLRNSTDLGDTVFAFGMSGVVVLLGVARVGWGLPSERNTAWAGDEIVPSLVLDAIQRSFSHGWHDFYPPTHFYLAALVYSPFVAFRWIGLLNGDAFEEVYTLLYVLLRSLSAVMSGVVMVAMFLAARRLGVPVRACRYALLALPSLPVFVFYGGLANADVPYVAWFAAAFCAYVYLVTGAWTRTTAAALGLLTALAVTTKDQAYGLFVLPALHVLSVAWSCAGQSAQSFMRRLLRVAYEPVLWVGLLSFLIATALLHNIVLNPAGVIAHFEMILGWGSQSYRMFPFTFDGQVGLATGVAGLMPWTLGWPVLLASAGGLAYMWRSGLRQPLVTILTPAVSYYVFLIAVVGYYYDRFLIALLPLLALTAGCGLQWCRERFGRPGLVVTGLALGSTALYGASVPALMWNDSRYDAERMIRNRYVPGTTIGYLGYLGQVPLYFPRLQGFPVAHYLRDEQLLRRAGPTLLITNEAYDSRWFRFPSTKKFYDDLAAGRLPYRRVYQAPPPPFTLLGLTGHVGSVPEFYLSSLGKLIAPICIYERESLPPGALRVRR